MGGGAVRAAGQSVAFWCHWVADVIEVARSKVVLLENRLLAVRALSTPLSDVFLGGLVRFCFQALVILSVLLSCRRFLHHRLSRRLCWSMAATQLIN